MNQIESPLSSLQVSAAFQPFCRQTHSKPGLKIFGIIYLKEIFKTWIENKKKKTCRMEKIPVGISSAEVATYSWLSSLNPAPSTTIFTIPTSFRSLPQSCKCVDALSQNFFICQCLQVKRRSMGTSSLHTFIIIMTLNNLKNFDNISSI